jgi:uncharacterized protein YkwD
VTRTGRRITPLLAGLLSAVVAVVTLVATTGPMAHAAVAGAHPTPALPLLPEPPGKHHSSSSGSSHLSGPSARVLSLTNKQRRAHGCRALVVDSILNRVAQQHSVDMARRGYFSHTDPGGSTWEKRQIAAGWSAEKTGGENIAVGPTSAAEVMNGWMHSPPHRRNILDCEFTTIGVGYSAKGHYWTQDFGF